ncbi:hypothetical protein [Neisseria zoodegmatis]|uniref:Uncharacterized protein n=1 Tax=Neisseria zoodegmatis TaxID=326523 RepID=A0A1X3CUU9_9NEIS|nr:hypothetical protein [Neisseria zoodegmatis]OSI11400.1 hypothetical protein BWD10_00010 [Neisseria zoodegmatis]SNU80057.1 Uncharacterised protein [Neisseria zoodegmatis]SUA35898.1 Uncharacterised protein [Neisseria zoodegmatis]
MIMMMRNLSKLNICLFFSVMMAPLQLMAEHPGFPDIPSTRSMITPEKMINEARVRPQDPKTNGYHVIDPYGNSYYVDNIVKPKCAFYANYINVDTSSSKRAGKVNQPKITSKAYIGKVNIKGCH